MVFDNIFICCICILLLLLIWVSIRKVFKNRRIKREFEYLVSRTRGFKADKAFIQPNGRCFIAIDDTNKLLMFGRQLTRADRQKLRRPGQTSTPKIDFKVLPYHEILGYHFVRGNSNSYHARKHHNHYDIRANAFPDSITLKLMLNDIQNPSYELPFYIHNLDRIHNFKIEAQCSDWQDTLALALNRRNNIAANFLRGF